VGAESFRADGRRAMTKLIVAFRNLASVPKKLACHIGLTMLTAKRQAKLTHSYHYVSVVSV
jgi:hypothetical protein